MTAEDILNEFSNSREYKAWKKSFSDILQYIKNEPDDEEYVDKILKNHFITSLRLYKGLEKAKEKYPEKRIGLVLIWL